mgnify:CR=1 FL=1
MQFKHPDPAVLDEEIFALLKMLGVSEGLIGSSATEYALGSGAKKWTLIGLNGEKLSLTNRTLLGLARALLSSVDLLLMSNVLDLLGPHQAKNGASPDTRGVLIHALPLCRNLTIFERLCFLFPRFQ